MSATNIDKQFMLSCKLVKALSKTPCDDDLLKLYGLFKQSTIGDCDIPEPNKIFDLKKNYKWTAWNKLKGTKQNDAKKKYTDMVMILIEKIGLKK
jgi:diazepam-binding inhibitor (GABA receptor modulating acyl-CoA-binding protein)